MKYMNHVACENVFVSFNISISERIGERENYESNRNYKESG